MPTKSQLQEEIRQTVPFRTKSQEAILAIRRTADVLRRKLAPVTEAAGVTQQQYNVLRILRGAEPEGLPTLEISRRMIEHAPGITGLLDRLEKKGLVTRLRLSSDRRCVMCRISFAGLDLLERLQPEVDAQDDALSALSERELSALIRALDKIRPIE